jgi:FkbM family methyltransferase
MAWWRALGRRLLGAIDHVPGVTRALIWMLSSYACARDLSYREWRVLSRCGQILLRYRSKWLVTLSSGLTFNVVDQSQYLNAVLLLKSRLAEPCWEPHSSLLLQRLVRPKDRVVVGGANIGFEALLVATRLAQTGGICYAVEPVQENFRILTENVALSGLTTVVRTLNLALGETDGTARMAVAGPRSSFMLPVEEARQEEVRVRSLDSLWREGVLEPAAALVADVEGFELEMLRGADAFIKRSPIRFMMLEFNRMTEQVSPGKIASVVDLLHRLGLACYAIDDDYRGFRRPTPVTGCLKRIERPDMPFVLPYNWFNVLAVAAAEVPALAAAGALAGKVA